MAEPITGDPITRKSQVNYLLDQYFSSFEPSQIEDLVYFLHNEFLNRKIKFPILEHCGIRLYEEVPIEFHQNICSKIFDLKTIGGNVLIAMLLQKRLEIDADKALSLAQHFTELADIWYICDIIGERVFGYHLLHQPEKMLPKIKKMLKEENRWVIRSLGAGIHLATKWGLSAPFVDEALLLLLTMAQSKDKEIRQGVGWAAKTIAKFHPQLVEIHVDKIEDPELVANWFRRKVQIGLERNKYAKRNRG
ncbi:MAG: DNA alkylation repair protein [Bacteroidota bacterium]